MNVKPSVTYATGVAHMQTRSLHTWPVRCVYRFLLIKSLQSIFFCNTNRQTDSRRGERVRDLGQKTKTANAVCAFESVCSAFQWPGEVHKWDRTASCLRPLFDLKIVTHFSIQQLR
jgi:hypothetical protein